MTIPFVFDRRAVLLLGSCFVLAGCGQQEEDSALASAFRGGDRFVFRDTVGWLDSSGRVATIGFFSRTLSSEERMRVLADQGVYPAIEPYDPMMEVRFSLIDPSKRILVDNIDAVQVTFWHFASPAPVIRFERSQIEDGSLSILGLDGEARVGGWAVGTIRGQEIVQTLSGRNVSYGFNLSFQSNLD